MIAWRKPVAVVTAAIAAAAAPTLLAILSVALITGEVTLYPWSFTGLLFVIALGHVVLLGLPIAAWLQYLGCLHALPVAVAGFFAGSLPYGLLCLFAYPSGWTPLITASVACGVLGVLAALTFLYSYRAIADGDSVRAS